MKMTLNEVQYENVCFKAQGENFCRQVNKSN